MSKITYAEIRMYRMGTGDCFAIKLCSEDATLLKIMIDAGTWRGTKKRLTPYIKSIMEYMDYHPDILIVTHEHKDHVHAFDACRELFTNKKFQTEELWLGWTEKDSLTKVENWKTEYGQKKKALGLMATQLNDAVKSDAFKKQHASNHEGPKRLALMRTFTNVLSGFADLHLSTDKNKVYVGGQKGMEVVKKEIKRKEIRYCRPGKIFTDIKEIEGLKFYILGPPEQYKYIAEETGGKGESYEHNKVLARDDAFSAAVLSAANNNNINAEILPFEMGTTKFPQDHQIRKLYEAEPWRKIDFDWLFSAGSFALRMNGLTNNLSLAIAIEVGEKVLLFPGDAEFGSWSSWHKINWPNSGSDTTDKTKTKHFTETLLNNTVFYKVAHHLSHNGTAQRLGLEMMKHTDLAAMATLDYDVIVDGWKSTMPNRAIIDELLTRTKGRLMIMSDKGLFYDASKEMALADKITESRQRMTNKEKEAFDRDLKETDLYLQYTVRF